MDECKCHISFSKVTTSGCAFKARWWCLTTRRILLVTHALWVCWFKSCNVCFSLTGNCKFFLSLEKSAAAFVKTLCTLAWVYSWGVELCYHCTCSFQRFDFPTLPHSNPANSQGLELVQLFRSLSPAMLALLSCFSLPRSMFIAAAAEVPHFPWWLLHSTCVLLEHP